MSGLAKLRLKEAVPLLEKLFESFGVKSVIALVGNEWTNVVTGIYLTRRKLDDLSNEYRYLEERLGKIDYANFKITLQARPIQEFHDVIMELQNGYLKIGDIQTKLLAKDPQKIVDQTIGGSNILRLGEYGEYNCYSVMLHMDYGPQKILSDCQISAAALGLRDLDELARSWLGLDSLQNPTNIYIIIPIYATIGEIQYQGGSEIKVTVKTDQRLFDSSSVWLTRQDSQGDRAPIVERRKYELASFQKVPQDEFIYTTIRHKFSAISPNDRWSVSLVHSELDLLVRKELYSYPFPSETSGSFLRAFNLFDAGKKMQEHLLSPKQAEDLVAAFSWLLEMIGIAAIQLGRDETIREDVTSIGSADVIACARESDAIYILAIDCTIGVPDEHKIDKIKNTADYISRKIGFPVKAMIVTSQKSYTTKELGQKHSVKIVDCFDLEKLIGLYKQGNNYHAMHVILGD